MSILVTGGTGFIGSHLCRHLVGSRGVHVTNLDKLTYAANPESLADLAEDPRYRFVHGDICDRATVVRTIAQARPEAIVHLAAESHVDRSIDGADDFVQTNMVGTYHLLEAARVYWDQLDSPQRATFRFLYVSTDEVYGSVETGEISEDGVYRPSSPYAATKAAGDHLAQAWHRTYGLPVLIAHGANTYGPHQFPEKLIPLTVIHALEGRELPVYGSGENERDWLHVSDHVRGLCAVLRTGSIGEIYNVSGQDVRRNIDVVQAVCGELDRLHPAGYPHSSLIRFVADRPGHDARYATDAAKLRTETGWHPEVRFESGLAQTVRWYAENEPWWRPIRERTYGGERLGRRHIRDAV